MILVLRALGVGDLAAAVPALRAVRAALPDGPLVLAAPAWLEPLAALTGVVDRLLPTDGLTPRPWPGRPAVAVNLHGRGPQSHRLLRAARPGRMWAFACPAAGHPDGPEWVEEEHEVRRWCRLVEHHGAPADPADLALRVPDAAGPVGATVVHPGAKSPSRRWPAERYAAVARALTARGHRVVVTGSAAERDLALAVAREAGLPDTAVPAGRTGLAELAAVVARARLVVCGDTGVAHLATGYGTPSVVLFGPMSPARWGPPPLPRHRAIWHGVRAEPGDAPGPGVHPALLRVGVTEVLAAADHVERAGRAVAAQ